MATKLWHRQWSHLFPSRLRAELGKDTSFLRPSLVLQLLGYTKIHSYKNPRFLMSDTAKHFKDERPILPSTYLTITKWNTDK